MSSAIEIGVIVPVYNVKRYLTRCVESILVQSYPIAEVVLVDDGSTDGSGELCEHLAAKHGIVRVVHKENAGLGFARNTGLDNLSSDITHVMFVDSDDWLEPGTVEAYAHHMEDGSVDCAIGGFTKRDDEGNALFEFKLKDDELQGEDLDLVVKPRVCGSAPDASDSIPMSVCSSMFKKLNIDESSLRFPSEREVISEDFAFKFKYLETCHKVVMTSCVGYSYRTNQSSLTTSYRPDRFEACLHFFDYACSLVSYLPSKDDCILRLQKTLFIYMKMCIGQEVSRVSGKSRRAAQNAIRQMTKTPRLLEIIEEYPCFKLGFKQRVFVELLKHHAAGILYFAAEHSVF